MSDSPLQTIDVVIMGLYMVGLVGLGLHYRRFAQASLENYFLGGRNLKGWLSGTSYAVTCYNAEVGTVYCGMTVSTGMFICWWYFSRFGLGLMIAALLFAVLWRKLKLFTSPEFYELRFSGKAGTAVRSWVSIRSAFIAVVAWTGAGLLGLSFIAQELMGWSRFETLAVVIPVIVVYVYLSGYMGVVVSDVIQSLILLVSALILMFQVLADFGGDAGWLAGPSVLYDALVAAFPDNPSVVRWYPPMDHAFLGLIGVIAWTVGSALGYGGDVAPVAGAMEGQRLLSTSSPKEASKMYIWTTVALCLMLATLTLPALGALAHRPDLYTASAAERERVFGWLLGTYMPPGFLGLALVALFASLMSTIDSNMNLGAQVFINDLYKRFLRPDAAESHYMLIGRIVMVAILILAIFVATVADSVIAFAVFMLQFSAAELLANWGQWWWWRFNGLARLTASFGGPIFFLINRFLIFPAIVANGYATQATADYLIVFASVAMTSVLWIIVALRTQPEPEAKLIAFYREVRPLGWWGPIAAKVEPVSTTTRPSIAQGLLLAGVGLVLIAGTTLALHAFYLGQVQLGFVFLAVAGIAGLFFKRSYGTYITQLETIAS